MRHATVRQLQIFSEAARTLSFARVAERLHLTPAAVSFQIKQLESLSGFALFERIGKKARLTAAGGALLVHARQILQSLEDADQALMALKGIAGRVTIGLVTTATYFVPHVLARFQAEFPQVSIRLRDGNRAQVIAMTTAGEVDLAVMGQPPADTDIEAEVFSPHPSVIIAAPGHRLAGRGALELPMMAGETFVVREDGSGTRLLIERAFPALGLEPRIGMVSSSNETIKQAVMAGMGLALISRHTIGMELGLRRIVELDVRGFPLMRSWFVAHRRRMQLLPAHAELRTFLLQRGAAIIEELESADRGAARSPATAAETIEKGEPTATDGHKQRRRRRL